MSTFPALRYFRESEFMNPYFDGNTYFEWDAMPLALRQNYEKTLLFIDWIRDHYKYALRINSSYRAKDGEDSPHRHSALDIVHFDPIDPVRLKIDWPSIIIDIIKKQDQFSGFRIFWEWQNLYNYGWIHIDHDERRKNWIKNENVFLIGFPFHGEMVYDQYHGVSPYDRAGMKLRIKDYFKN